MPLNNDRTIIVFDINRSGSIILVMMMLLPLFIVAIGIARLPPSFFQASAKETPAPMKIIIVVIANIFAMLIFHGFLLSVEFTLVRRDRRREDYMGWMVLNFPTLSGKDDGISEASFILIKPSCHLN
jgi:hypothetical protein